MLELVGSMEAPSKVFLLFFLLPNWLKLNHLKSRMEFGFSDIFSRHICYTVAETISVTNYAASFGAKNVQKTRFEAAEIVLGPWNQQTIFKCNRNNPGDSGKTLVRSICLKFVGPRI